MQFVDGSHKSGFFEQIQYNIHDGNVLSDHSDLVIPHQMEKNIIQTELLPGQASFHDGNFVCSKEKRIQNNQGFVKK